MTALKIPPSKRKWTTAEVTAWAAEHRLGTFVRYWPVRSRDAHEDHAVLSEPWLLGDGTPVVRIGGKSGGVALDHLRKIPIEDDARELERYRTACEEVRRRGLAEFLEWLAEHFTVAETWEDKKHGRPALGEGNLVPTSLTEEQLFARYFEIDLAAVERARQRLCDRLAEEHERREQEDPWPSTEPSP